MRRWFLSVPLVVLFAAGCTSPAENALQPGDVVQPEVAFAPRDPWPADARVALGMLLKLERPGDEVRYLRDDEVNPDQAVMQARVTFLDGDRLLGDPLEVPFVRDC